MADMVRPVKARETHSPTMKECHCSPVRQLPDSIEKDGYTLRLVQRQGPFAIFRQSKPGAATEAFEVIRIELGKPHPRDTNQSGLVERYPSAESWGVDGFTFLTLQAAEIKLLSLSKGLR